MLSILLLHLLNTTSFLNVPQRYQDRLSQYNNLCKTDPNKTYVNAGSTKDQVKKYRANLQSNGNQ